MYQYFTNKKRFKSYKYSTPAPITHSKENVINFAEKDVFSLSAEITRLLQPQSKELQRFVHYQFDGTGKLVRPLIISLFAASINRHIHGSSGLPIHDNHSSETPLSGLGHSSYHRQLGHIVSESQNRIALIAEMIHTASLIHDDILDSAHFRRGKPSTQKSFGQKEAAMAGDFVLTTSSQILARLRNPDVVAVLTTVIEDLIKGEFMQLSCDSDSNQRFKHYFTKTYRKTASLIANSCKAVAMLSSSSISKDLVDVSYEIGLGLGMAFQLLDDVLDIESSAEQLGKPASADLSLGLATGPVLFATLEFPELNAMILRKFSSPGDKERALELIHKSSGIQETKMLAKKYHDDVMEKLGRFQCSSEQEALIDLTHRLIIRDK